MCAPEGTAEWLAEGEAEDEPDGDAEGETDGDTDGEAEGDADGDVDGLTDGLTEGDAEGDADGEADGLTEGEADGEADGDIEGDADGEAEGEADGDVDGEAEGDADGEADGDAEGDADGEADGEAEGEAEGDADGEADGDAEGDADGEADGDVDGDAEGDADGEVDGDGDVPPQSGRSPLNGYRWNSDPDVAWWISDPAVKNRPFIPGTDTVVVLAWLPISMLPWNWALPLMVTVVASGKFHSSRSRSPAGMAVLPMKLLIVRLVPVRLTRTVAPLGMPRKVMPWSPPVALTMSKSTLNTWSADVPSPVNSVSKPTLTAVPVACRSRPSGKA
ncbi:hypothetical protein EHYA_00976 [Embleya hyalina]|uniref:Uncharacterized protein n=1 Tax=Embleya hyalina TaxID=516124 RepID=A0A401YFF9_9ACTN|nr:hypothetical protein EHYA_00976 [Embleya hyalina]